VDGLTSAVSPWICFHPRINALTTPIVSSERQARADQKRQSCRAAPCAYAHQGTTDHEQREVAAIDELDEFIAKRCVVLAKERDAINRMNAPFLLAGL
jgi:hypothetical protein